MDLGLHPKNNEPAIMKKLYRTKLFLILLIVTSTVLGQQQYVYTVDLDNVKDDKLSFELTVPQLAKHSLVFSFPKIIPGTYMISNYGRFVSDLKAWDKAGKSLPVSKLDENQWKISNANNMSRITYSVDDIFDSEIKHGIFPMAATNIEAGKNFVFNTPGFFGFFEGYNQLPFTLDIKKPKGFFASTSLVPTNQTPTTDRFLLKNVDELYDSPIMYSLPDTTTIRVGNCDVLISVYSPKKMISSRQIADWMSELLKATKDYLGGRLPTDKYAFLYYFNDATATKNSFPPGEGALEHAKSSFYYFTEKPAQQIRQQLIDVSSHEFFHIITPLTIASKEIKQFNFHKPVLSQHLWLYEGSTEYTAHHVQVKYGLKPLQQFLAKLTEKITVSRTYYNDSLSFTEMSKAVTDTYEKQYGNVYMKGALIAACLDVYLLHLSDGMYGFRNLTYDLGVRYGKNRSFNDDELFSSIEELTYPEIGEFLKKHVSGSTPIPYDYYFGLAGIKHVAREERKVMSLGGFMPAVNNKNQIFIQPQTKFNAFGIKLGYKGGDEIYAFNGTQVSTQNFGQVVESTKKNMKVGELLKVKVGRPNATGVIDTVMLSAPIELVTEVDVNKLQPMQNPTPKQTMVQKAWLTATEKSKEPLPPADGADVASIDAIIKALYDAISGPAGPRNWTRFNSLFTPEAMMGATVTNPAGKTELHSFTPGEYGKMNTQTFMQTAFYEQELGRNVSQYGNVAMVASAYHYKFQPDGPVIQRGVNYFTLVKSDGRWYVANLTWQDETPDNPIPASLLKN
jgi:predicted metalloprotease with PDZ domain